MNARVLEKETWISYFDTITKEFKGQQIEVELLGLDVGDQIEQDWVNFEGLSYDSSADALHVHSEALDHAITAPLEISVLEEGSLAKAILIKDSLDHAHIIRFRPIQEAPSSSMY